MLGCSGWCLNLGGNRMCCGAYKYKLMLQVSLLIELYFTKMVASVFSAKSVKDSKFWQDSPERWHFYQMAKLTFRHW